MATVSQPKRHDSSLFRHHSSHRSRPQSEERIDRQPGIFEGTDAITQNRRVALQRVLEVHDALELKHHNETLAFSPATSERPSTASSASASGTPLPLNFSEISVPNAEVRSFRYLVRQWDPSAPADPEFEQVVAPTRQQFEETAVKHFLQRIALWNASEAAKEQMSRSVWRRRERSASELGKLRMTEKGYTECSARDELKEVTTRAGLAQLLWTLLHGPLAPVLMAECTEALKRKYGMT